jgi:hypothetical protein
MRKIAYLILITLAAVLLPSQASTSSTPPTSPRSALLSSMMVSISYKDQVRLTPKKCGEFEIKYSVRQDPKRALVELFDLDGKLLGDYTINRFSELRREWDDPKGTIYIEYCKTKWKDDWGNTWPAFKGGRVFVNLTVYGSMDVTSVQKGQFFVKK